LQLECLKTINIQRMTKTHHGGFADFCTSRHIDNTHTKHSLRMLKHKVSNLTFGFSQLIASFLDFYDQILRFHWNDPVTLLQGNITGSCDCSPPSVR
jgi:hypothetical protein